MAKRNEGAGGEVSQAWSAFVEIGRQLDVATDFDIRADLHTVREDLRARIAELRNDREPRLTRDQLEAELDAREQQLSDLFQARIVLPSMLSGDGATLAGYRAGPKRINDEIDKRYCRAETEQRIRELRRALAKLNNRN